MDARVFLAMRENRRLGLKPGDRIVWDEENEETPFVLVRPLTMIEAGQRIAAAGMVEVKDPSSSSAGPLPLGSPASLRQSVRRARHLTRLK